MATAFASAGPTDIVDTVDSRQGGPVVETPKQSPRVGRFEEVDHLRIKGTLRFASRKLQTSSQKSERPTD